MVVFGYLGEVERCEGFAGRGVGEEGGVEGGDGEFGHGEWVGWLCGIHDLNL
jgi:hypothetical protein